MPKNILIIVTKGNTGGAQQSVFNLAKGLKNKGENVTVAFGEGDFLKQKLVAENIQFHQFQHLKRSTNPLTNLLFIFELRAYLKNNHFTSVHFNSSNTLLGAIGIKLAKNPPQTVFTFRGLSLVDNNYTTNIFTRTLFRLYFKILLNFIDNQVYVSRENQNYAKLIGLAKNDVVIYNGLPSLNFIDKDTAKKQLSEICQRNLSNNFIIGSIGRLAYQKNYEFLIQATPEILKTNPLIKIIIIGEGPEKNNYLKLIRDLKLENDIILIGDIPDAYQYLMAFDVFVLPSRYEGMSITLIEAMQAGLPILTTSVGGAKEMLNNNQAVYELNDQKEFLNKLKALITNEQTRQSLSTHTKTESQKFDINKTVGSYFQLYK